MKWAVKISPRMAISTTWSPTTRRVELSPQEVHLWRASLSTFRPASSADFRTSSQSRKNPARIDLFSVEIAIISSPLVGSCASCWADIFDLNSTDLQIGYGWQGKPTRRLQTSVPFDLIYSIYRDWPSLYLSGLDRESGVRFEPTCLILCRRGHCQTIFFR